MKKKLFTILKLNGNSRKFKKYRELTSIRNNELIGRIRFKSVYLFFGTFRGSNPELEPELVDTARFTGTMKIFNSLLG